SKEFGDFDYSEAAQIVVQHGQVIDAAWLQRRLSIDSDRATSLLLRLLESNVIQLEAEGDSSLEHTYRVVGTLEQAV
ncbi:hypothetical protein NY997_15890, partial [Escherichia coli]|uniref:hypothetical protein n=1 Tax=Escherichia coli TaxID=562 RepID=UPI0022F10683